MALQTGGKTVFGASIGILMLETRFPRIPGDMGNALTWPFPVHYRVVRGATPENIVLADPRDRLGAFIDAGRDLVAMGCDAITTNCGFLALLQDQLSDALGVPVAASALMQIPMIRATLPPGQIVSVLTISEKTLSPAHIAAAGAPADTPIVGTDHGQEFTRKILSDAIEIDFDQCRADLLQAADRLMVDHPNTGAIVLECTNMVPYAADIRRATGRPVFSIETLVTWLHAATSPRRYPLEIDDPRIG